MAYTEISIFGDVYAPAPRYLMRLALIEELIEALPSTPCDFLEIGPGTGDVSLYLARRFPLASGTLVDFSQDSTDLLRKRLERVERLTIQTGVFQQMGLIDRFDLVVACEVFEHLADDGAGLRAVHGMLRPGGHFLFSVPAFMRKWQHVDDYAGHYRRYEPDEIRSKFAACGLQIETFWCYGFPVTHLTYPVRQFYYRRSLRAQTSPASKEMATMKSGVERPVATRLRRYRLDRWMQPFFWVQRQFRDTLVGDGFLVLARRSDRSDRASA